MEKPNPRRPSNSVLPYETPRLRDHYLLGKKLGQGQFGTTYLCTEKSSSSNYACKSIPKRKLVCREDYEDVWREIQIMHHLSEHPNVVRIKGTYEDSVFVHIVMEVCEGGELFDRIVSKGHFSEREAVKLIKTILGVVEACHSLGVMHRDLKPENFLFDSASDDAKLQATDFGLSVFYKPGHSQLTRGLPTNFDKKKQEHAPAVALRTTRTKPLTTPKRAPASNDIKIVPGIIKVCIKIYVEQ